ncbi:MAG: GDP-mannose 4,6-dehydratase [Parvibaculales bacterium]
MAKTALITGITGQDGAYLAQLLLEKGYTVVGAMRRTASLNLARLAALGIDEEVAYVNFDVNELSNIMRVLEQVKPDEIYNLAAQSFVQASFEQPLYTAQTSGVGTMRLLEAMRTLGTKAKFYQASTSEMFGRVQQTPQNEETPFYPRSPYGIAKLFAHWSVVNYREAYGLHACSGILFNHESPLRGMEFVTRKITSQLAKIIVEQDGVLELGNLEAQRDWGYAPDYVEAMWLMLQYEKAEDFVVATGQTHSVRAFVELACETLGLDIAWQGSGVEETAIDRKTGRVIVRINPDFYRPAEVDLLVGDAAKAHQKLGWRPTTDFRQLVGIMSETDLRRARDGARWF